MEIKFSNKEIENIIIDHLQCTFPAYTKNKLIELDKYFGDVKVYITEKEKAA